MISAVDFIQLKAFARQDGFFIGLLWIITFACFIGSMSTPDLQIGFIGGVLLTPIITFLRLKHFRDKVLDGVISYRRAVAFVMFTLGYASIIIAAATFVYFYFFDNGAFLQTIRESIERPEIQQSFKQMGMDMALLNEQMTLFGQSRPIDFAFNMFWNGMTTGFVLSLIMGVFGRRKSNNILRK